MPARKLSDAEMLAAAKKLASRHGMYIVERTVVVDRQIAPIYLLCRRLPYGGHGTLLGRRLTPKQLLRFVKRCMKVAP